MHIDLFTGIGGFTLACRWNGIKTEVFCENDKRCQNFLRKTYPDVPIIPDIRDFDGTKWQGRFLLTGGVPCQPASRAGKQRGKKDDRWLWPEAIRVVAEARPTWCLFENPAGIYDVGIDGILSHLESIGYETGIVEIPACAVGAPHIRQRVWILAKSIESGAGDNQQEIGGQRGATLDTGAKGLRCRNGKACPNEPDTASQSHMADTDEMRRGRWTRKSRQTGWKESENCNLGNPTEREQQSGSAQSDKRNMVFSSPWENSVWLACADGKVRRAPDDTFGVADGLHRSVLAALGNSIVPQVAYEIVKAIKMTIR